MAASPPRGSNVVPLFGGTHSLTAPAPAQRLKAAVRDEMVATIRAVAAGKLDAPFAIEHVLALCDDLADIERIGSRE